MNSRTIFKHRFSKNWKHQVGVFKSVADWTVMLYIIIPAIVIFLFNYQSWWNEIPIWMENVPMFLLLNMLYFFSWSGTIRTFVEEADKVFLIKQVQTFTGLKKRGYFYSILIQSCMIVLMFAIILPFLFVLYELNWHQIVSLCFYFITLKTGIMMLKYQIGKFQMKFVRVLLYILFFSILNWGSQLIFLLHENFIIMASGLILLLSIYGSLTTIGTKRNIDYDIEREQISLTKNIELIFSFSPQVEKVHKSNRTKPFFFRRSKRIFKKRTAVNGFVELFIKAFMRDPSYVGGYFQIISVTIMASIVIPPLWLKGFIFVSTLGVLYFWLNNVWNKLMASNPLIKKYHEEVSYFSAKNKGVTLFFLTALFIIVLLLIGVYSLMSHFSIPLSR